MNDFPRESDPVLPVDGRPLEAMPANVSVHGGDRRALTADAGLAKARAGLGTLVRHLKRYGLLGD